MRAINLVPADSRPGRVSGGKSGGAVFGLMGVLVVALIATSFFALAKRDEAQANQELATVESSTAAYTQVATQYASFENAAKQANERIETVRSLAQARFDWAGALRDFSRLVPETTRIGSISASVDATSGQTAGGSASQFRGSLPVPAIAMNGCSLSQTSVADLVTNLQAMRRVTNVTLESSKLAKQQASTNIYEDTGCRHYEFVVVVFFAPGNAKSSADAAPSANAATTTVSTEAAGGSAPTTPDATTPTTPAAGN